MSATRRGFLALTTALAACGPVPRPAGDAAHGMGASGAPLPAGLDPATASASALLRALQSGALSAVRLTQFYLERIAGSDQGAGQTRAVIELNPDAAKAAAAADAQRTSGAPLGPLHGLPVLIKDNIETADRMMTTAGSLALSGWFAPRDAPLVARLRRAGAIVLGKSNLSEWANFRSTHSLSGWSARGGQTRNARDALRSPSGSSSGSAVAVSAGLCALAVGTETDGSIVSPASVNGLVGLKPTVGLVSRSGIIPIAQSQDTAGPMARTVADAALLLGALAGSDSEDVATRQAPPPQDYQQYARADGLAGARLGIARAYFAGNPPLNRFLDGCVQRLRAAGAVLVDPCVLPDGGVLDHAELEVLLYEFKDGLNRYLERLPANMPARTLEQLIAFNLAQREQEMPWFEQELFVQSQAKGPLSDAAYRRARQQCLRGARGGLDAVLARQKLDAVVALTNGPAWLIDPVNGDAYSGGCSSLAAMAGYPHITVPAGSFRGLPVGLSFFGAAWSEPTLIRLAAGFEATRPAAAA